MGRYISSNEAVWRILKFPIHERYPAVLTLSVHLENGQRVYFTAENVNARVQAPPVTTLTAFFDLCKHDDFARTLLYCDVPRYYTWNSSKKFKRRTQGRPVQGHPDIKQTDALGRVYTVHPNNFECFCLRLLLHVVHGPTCFNDVRTFQGAVCPTFRDAANKQGLLEDDAHWNATLGEAAVVQSPMRLRSLFAIMLRSCEITDPQTLRLTYRDSMAEDILMKTKRANPTLEIVYTDTIYNQALLLLEDNVLALDGKDLQSYGLDTPQRSQEHTLSKEVLLVLRETSYDLEQMVQLNEPRLTPDQCEVY